MTERRVRRRLTMWLVAALLGAFAVVAPADAATTCTLTFKANWRGTVGGQHRWQIDAKLTNTGTTPSTTWAAVIDFPYSAGAVIYRYWSTTKISASVWHPVAWNGALYPNQSAYPGFEIDVPVSNTSPPLPTSSQCSITY
ncbi:hypothetical protein FDA94_05385 [Herbidospora galbida]|uniref:CBM2 domain-containing protein n=1 Tax=Herbidospora galbida TaxID=2575442 RepID=A0A4U3MLM2_9ACTN|nr:cellulose binding domain-containing protein [Herbidospora galbida]TKK90435.1 hypothetical protein FDA94_05385 [Herbidospora galbida]